MRARVAVCGTMSRRSLIVGTHMRYPAKHKPQERTMAAFTGFRTPVKLGTDALPLAQGRRSPDWMIWTALAVFLATGPALPQAGVSLVRVDLSVVAQGYRLSKVIGSSVINERTKRSAPLMI
jgi:hypothetical protein